GQESAPVRAPGNCRPPEVAVSSGRPGRSVLVNERCVQPDQGGGGVIPQVGTGLQAECLPELVAGSLRPAGIRGVLAEGVLRVTQSPLELPLESNPVALALGLLPPLLHPVALALGFLPPLLVSLHSHRGPAEQKKEC